MKYIIWGHSTDQKLCCLNPPENIEDAFELNYGISRKEDFPSNALIRMNKEYKTAIKLADALDNINFLIVASKRLKEFFEAQKIPNTEYLRVKILNHKNRIASDEYYIVHQVGTQDCIDLKHSVVTWNKINPDQISSVKSLILEEARVQREASLFRAKHLPSVIFIRQDLATKIEEAGFTGIVFKNIETFTQV